jgi:two-component system, response regulator, stage 0 sporulation protein F
MQVHQLRGMKVEAVMARTSHGATEDASRLWRRSVRARVLVAEDDQELRSLVVYTLVNDGYEVYEADSGDAVVRLLQSASSETPPGHGLDLVILDHKMPRVSGLEIAQQLRSANWPTPLILITAFPARALLDEARSLSMRVLAKPFSLSALSTMALSVLLSERARRRIDPNALS